MEKQAGKRVVTASQPSFVDGIGPAAKTEARRTSQCSRSFIRRLDVALAGVEALLDCLVRDAHRRTDPWPPHRGLGLKFRAHASQLSGLCNGAKQLFCRRGVGLRPALRSSDGPADQSHNGKDDCDPTTDHARDDSPYRSSGNRNLPSDADAGLACLAVRADGRGGVERVLIGDWRCLTTARNLGRILALIPPRLGKRSHS